MRGITTDALKKYKKNIDTKQQAAASYLYFLNYLVNLIFWDVPAI